jgi:hypothetical protein
MARRAACGIRHELIDRALPHLTSRDPESFWTSGQWMTEAVGGSDVGRSETRAVPDEEGGWRRTAINGSLRPSHAEWRRFPRQSARRQGLAMYIEIAASTAG